jgi:hypothetical protein
MGPVDKYLDAITGASIAQCDSFRSDVELDATVPNWRFVAQGDAAVRTELSGWLADPGEFEELTRTPLPSGELITFTLRWEEGGVPHAAHQAHVVGVETGVITRIQAWCGGRWSGSELAAITKASGGDT